MSSSSPPVIAVFFDDPSFEGYPFDDPEYRAAYHDLAALIVRQGAAFFIARGQKSYLGKNSFAGGWRFDGRTFVEHPKRVDADLIFQKGHLQTDARAKILNWPAFDDLCTDKAKTAEAFADLSPRTILVHSKEELQRAIRHIPSPMIVAKPLDSFGGKGVVIGSPEKALASVTSFPYLIQQCIDMSGGIPGLAAGRHDLRLLLINGKLLAAYLRVPKAGSFLANVSQGGTIAEIPLHNVPAEAKRVAATIDKELTGFAPRVYSIDLARDKSGKWFIIELNAQPGLPGSEAGEDGKNFMKSLAEALVRYAKKSD